VSKFIWTVLLAVCVLVFAGTQPVRAAEPTTPGVVNVTGDAEIKVAPDEVVLILGVETGDKNMQVAKNQNDERVKKVIAMTKDFGIDPKYVQTSQIQIEPRYEGASTKYNFIGYFIYKTIVITLKDVDKFENVYSTALVAGATHVEGIQFRTTELRKYRDQARALALKAAQEKASAMAGTLGQKIGEPQSIREDYSGWWSWYNPRWGSPMSQNVVQNAGGRTPNEEGTFAPGQISVTASVSVGFALQ
jgi:uncharacterized protein YggE